MEEAQNKKDEKELADDLQKCKKESQEYLNGWKRAKADFINYKKDEAKRMEELLGITKLLSLKDFIPILDNLDKAIDSFKSEGKTEKGIDMIRSQLMTVFKKHGLEEIEVEAGYEFDPNFHEGVEEVDSKIAPGRIVEELEKGYLLDGQVVRPTKVKLSKGEK